jgi:hypothetical protein
MPPTEREAKIEQAKKKQRAALDGTAKVERVEMRAADEARVLSLVPRPGFFGFDPRWRDTTLPFQMAPRGHSIQQGAKSYA